MPIGLFSNHPIINHHHKASLDRLCQCAKSTRHCIQQLSHVRATSSTLDYIGQEPVTQIISTSVMFP
ncbi:hypothetical protein SLEP1_g47549 [Rubroshorea leprosula]|uniref:Uncharacterized protein n=1 Tax=Rubroshorea leprosula TaxID=152421 RepID=A0AAV5LQU2_9ROSI|nr:hypothetical protein SLEP1_g47549 [Rubroshorea leprosula]